MSAEGTESRRCDSKPKRHLELAVRLRLMLLRDEPLLQVGLPSRQSPLLPQCETRILILDLASLLPRLRNAPTSRQHHQPRCTRASIVLAPGHARASNKRAGCHRPVPRPNSRVWKPRRSRVVPMRPESTRRWRPDARRAAQGAARFDLTSTRPRRTHPTSSTRGPLSTSTLPTRHVLRIAPRVRSHWLPSALHPVVVRRTRLHSL